MTQTLPALMNRRCAAEALGVSMSTLRKWRHEGRGPRPLRLTGGPRGRCVYRREDIEAFIAGLAAAPAERFDPPPRGR